MTGYHLRIGYMSEGGTDHAWERLRAVVDELAQQPARIAAEVIRLEPAWGDAEALEFAQQYQSGDQSCRILDAGPDDRQVMQLASGGGTARALKEATRRAFCRLVIEALHRERIEVSLVVA